MENTSDRETRDFMSVESFSQLPFLRSAPPHEGPGAGASAGAIRLFGKDFKTNTYDDSTDSHAREIETNKDSSDGTEPSNRKFECHYCCRIFPTSQALGGHQNAHKRERQQAKRARLHSTMLHGSLADPHVYGYMNYGRLATAPPLPLAYHPLAAGDSYTAASSRIYGGYGSFAAHPHPINGSPLAHWRVPAAHYSPVLARDHHAPPPAFKPLTSPSSQFRFGYESK